MPPTCPPPPRDRSLKAFLRRYVAGLLPPATGTPDEQANCFARLSPLVALYAGAPLDVLAAAAERMIRWAYGRCRGGGLSGGEKDPGSCVRA